MNNLKNKCTFERFINCNKRIFYGLVLLIFFIATSFTKIIAAEKIYTDEVALNGLKEIKGVVWLSLKEAKKTAQYLKIFTGTQERAFKQGVKLDMVLIFNGSMVNYLTSQPKDEVVIEYNEYLTSISQSISMLNKLGVRMEACGIATKFMKVDPETLLPGITNVSDSAISLIGWQYQGYKVIPIF